MKGTQGHVPIVRQGPGRGVHAFPAVPANQVAREARLPVCRIKW